MTPAETTLSLLFKKLHPHLEDAAHALAKGAKANELQRLYLKLALARHQVVDILEPLSETIEDEALADVLDTLAANLMPVGENYQQSLILTQLCLEEAPKDLLLYVPEGAVGTSTWGPRMLAFLQKLEDPAFHAHARWKDVDESVGETEEE